MADGMGRFINDAEFSVGEVTDRYSNAWIYEIGLDERLDAIPGASCETAANAGHVNAGPHSQCFAGYPPKASFTAS